MIVPSYERPDIARVAGRQVVPQPFRPGSDGRSHHQRENEQDKFPDPSEDFHGYSFRGFDRGMQGSSQGEVAASSLRPARSS